MESVRKLEIIPHENEKETGHPADPKSPAVPVQVENIPTEGSATETDDEKIILTLESLHYSSESAESAKKIEENQKALEKLDKLLQSNSISRKKVVRAENSEKGSGISVTVKGDSNEKKAPRILNASFSKVANSENKRLLNNAGKAIPTEEDLLAILEGDNHDEEGDVDIKVIEDTAFGKKKTITTVLLSKNQELRIAADQMKNIGRKQAGRKQIIKDITGNINSVSSNSNELVSSLASEWSDNERENVDEKPELKNNVNSVKEPVEKEKAIEPKMVVLPKNIISPAINYNVQEISNDVAEPKVDKPEQTTGIAPFKRSRVIKKKIIWDPDAPETQFSYASLIKPKVKQVLTKKVVQKKTTNDSSIKPESEPMSKKVVVEKMKPPTTNRKRKEASPDKVDENIEQALNDILSEETGSGTAVNSENTAPLSIKTKEAMQGIKKPRVTKGKQSISTSSSWDYINKGQSDEMMIIRRRSSSYSSTTSQRRLSLEQQGQSQQQIKVVRKASATEPLKNSPVKKRRQEIQLKKVKAVKHVIENQGGSVKSLPTVKKLSAGETKKLAPPSPTSSQLSITIQRKSSRQTPTSDLERTNVTSPNSSSTNSKPQKNIERKIKKLFEEKPKSDIEIILKKMDSVVNFIIDIKTENPANTFSLEFIRKFISTLEHLKEDNSCKVVVVTSKGTHFCHGIDFTCLMSPNIEKRTIVANELSKYIKLFFETLINFNKPIIAAVGGVVSNLGVTMLPLFDMVFASDKCAFEMSYPKIGQIPEGNCILSAINMDSKYKMKLVYLAEKLTANEALSSGLITAIFPTQRLDSEAINVATKLASLSQQTYKSLKQLRVQKFATEGIVKALEVEQNFLIEHWISSECQEKFKELLQKK